MSDEGPYVARYGDYYPKELQELLLEAQEAYRNKPDRPDYPEKAVPEGWPAELPPSPMIWDAETFPKDESHVVQLSADDVVEVEAALKSVEVHIFHALTRGFTENLSPIFNNHAQVFHSDMIADVLCMYCLTAASSGGANSYASIPRIYNHLAEHTPEIIHTLAAPDWPFDTYGYNPPYHTRPLLFYNPPEQEDAEENDGDSDSDDGDRTPRASELNYQGEDHEDTEGNSFDPQDSNKNGIKASQTIGRILASLSPRQLSGSKVHPRPSTIPALTEPQVAALQEIESLCQKFCITETLSSGSMVFVNNLSILHNRSKYSDPAEKPVEEHRHLIRIFLRNEDLAWTTPRELLLDWGRAFGDFDGVDEKWVADKEKDFKDQQRGLIELTAGGEGGEGAY
ncbi:hypothetical protein ABW20_dc0105314 [Dactylellina cionopaga]|nr:hypothetical protein ABW20_dc0105314 [Dactylellina cionopaga]